MNSNSLISLHRLCQILQKSNCQSKPCKIFCQTHQRQSKGTPKTKEK